MALLIFDRVMEVSQTTGLGPYTLMGAVQGFSPFSVLGVGNSCHYCAQAVDGNGNPAGAWEIGVGTYSLAPASLSRDTVLASTNGGAAVNWPAGSLRVFLCQPAATAIEADRVNTFTVEQLISAVNPALTFVSKSQAVDKKKFQIVGVNEQLWVQALNDAQTLGASVPLILERTGDVRVYRDAYEKQRTTPMGHWTEVPFNAGDYTAGGGMVWTVAANNVYTNSYALVGRTLLWSLFITGATLSGTAGLNLTLPIPTGVALARPVQAPVLLNVGGAWAAAILQAISGTTVNIYTMGVTNLTLGTMYLSFQVLLSI